MDWLAASADAYPDLPAVITADRTVSYAELDRAADGVASIITSSGLFGSHAVAFWGDRSIETIAAVWGIPRAGITAVAVDPDEAPASSIQTTRAAGVRGLWITPAGGFDRLLDRGTEASATSRPGIPYIVSTSGTVGGPREVLVTEGNLIAAVAGSQKRLGNSQADAWLCVLPLFHVAGLSVVWRQAESGGPVVLLDRFDPAAAAAALDDVTFASLVPVMLRRILDTGRAWAGLTAVLVGGAAADGHLISAARSAGIPALPTYGMTETCSQIATHPPEAAVDGSVGLPLPGAEIRVMAQGVPVMGAEGLIEVRGAMLSPGYVGEPPRPNDGWFRTGDVGVLGNDGRLTVLGRADSVIITGGENVHPGLVEAELRSHSEIRDVRVYGIADEEWGEIVAAEVETDLPEEELDALATGLAPVLRPRRWSIVPRIARKLDD